jgi:regulator of cell morphogenesis and NO signaling
MPVRKYESGLSALRPPRNAADARCDGTLVELVQYTLDRHHGYLKSELPRLESLLVKTAAVPCDRHGAMLHHLRRSFQSFKADMELHLHKEQTVLFPAVIRMACAHPGSGVQVGGAFGTFSNIIRTMQREHEEMIAALEQMRDITSGYGIPKGAGETLCCLIEGLAALDANLRFQLEFEDNLLFPSIEKLAHKGDGPRT